MKEIIIPFFMEITVKIFLNALPEFECLVLSICMFYCLTLYWTMCLRRNCYNIVLNLIFLTTFATFMASLEMRKVNHAYTLGSFLDS
jgi:hypothetical protein